MWKISQAMRKEYDQKTITPQETRTNQQLKCKLKVKTKKGNLSKENFERSQ